MSTVNLTESGRNRSALMAEVEAEGGRNIRSCYQCGKCSAGCPVLFAMDWQPHQVMRLVHLGLKDVVLKSSSIWVCASCITCTTRCPRRVDIAGVMEALRIMARKHGYPAREKSIAMFHDIFLDTVRQYGRLHELGMLGKFKLATGNLFQDLGLGPRMMIQGKLSLAPHRIAGAAAIRRIYDKIRDYEKIQGGEGVRP